MTPAQFAFALRYLENGFNATDAYRQSYPGVKDTTAASEGWRTLRNPKVAAYLKERVDAGWRALQMGGEEAMARVAWIATFDIRRLFDAKGKLLPVHQWPEDAGQVVEGLEGDKVKLASRLTALRIVLEQTGKLKTLAGGIDELAAAIRADFEKHQGAGQ